MILIYHLAKPWALNNIYGIENRLVHTHIHTRRHKIRLIVLSWQVGQDGAPSDSFRNAENAVSI
jgi:hypothetical protein